MMSTEQILQTSQVQLGSSKPHFVQCFVVIIILVLGDIVFVFNIQMMNIPGNNANEHKIHLSCAISCI